MDTSLESEDFYINEKGFVVLTEAFLKKRGFCCKNNCLHCPYESDPSASSGQVSKKR